MTVRLSSRGEALLGGVISLGIVLVMWGAEIVSAWISGVPQ